MKKRTTSILLAALLIAVIIPAAVFAAEDHNVMLTSQQPGVEIQDQGITWIKEESVDVDLGRSESVWYGVDNGTGEFEPGSRLSIRWINKESDPEEAEWYQELVDDRTELRCKDKGYYIIWQIVGPDNEAVKLKNPVALYVQIPDDWDDSDVEAYYIDEGQDERVMVEKSSVVSPDGSRDLIKLTVNHLDAPLLIAEKASFAASVWTHFQPAVTIGIVLIIAVAAVMLIRKKNESK